MHRFGKIIFFILSRLLLPRYHPDVHHLKSLFMYSHIKLPRNKHKGKVLFFLFWSLVFSISVQIVHGYTDNEQTERITQTVLMFHYDFSIHIPSRYRG